MSKYMFKTNQDRCISCNACEVHCKQKNKVPVGAKLGQMITVGPLDRAGKPRMMNLFMPCYHCEQPWCVAACPSGAMVRREEDGVVYVQRDLCVGCKACIIACPWDIPQWDEAAGKVIKCDLCKDRLDAGLKPACVTACTTHALEFTSSPNARSAKTRTEHGQKMLLKKVLR
ncbi:4Fe-4S dicluster domain-containing protein [Desulfocurvus vexinensis]|uniref:4Fe-4S dicluster domain-containing protein n=1 Tax=Desulfocurvus vexinensis TaxID=399548 RepID=UPI00048A63DA|nr:4Fe-4S dicluster domain-containing protein [Desulfocurvus vexinensis]